MPPPAPPRAPRALLLLLCLALANRASAIEPLGALAAAVCGCAECLLSPLPLDAGIAVVDYGNGSAGVMDWLGAARDFLPAPVLLTSTAEINCTQALAALMNGTSVVEQYAWTQRDNVSCIAAVEAGLAPGDYAFVAGVRSPNATLVFSQPYGRDEAFDSVATFSLNAAALALEPSVADCALPLSFAYCGANFTQVGCGPGTASYAGTCTEPMGAPPTWCYGLPLFEPPPAVPPCGPGCQVAVVVSGVGGAAVAFTAAAGASVLSNAGATVIAAGTQAFGGGAPVAMARAAVDLPLPAGGLAHAARVFQAARAAGLVRGNNAGIRERL